ncbi:MAG: zinc ribbon domain-containing protein [candidate division Zixibacteria bacterium]|nr:zinc ribbon domain-containing protein [candidate division Zixibacteria bacterium]
MPIYEYTCRNCEHHFEELVRGDEGTLFCPVCQSMECKREFSVFGFSSGSGFVSSTGAGCTGCSSHNCKGCK